MVVAAAPEGWRLIFYNLFTSIRPLAVSEMQECIQKNHIPQNRFVSDALAIRRQIEVIEQSIQQQHDPVIAERMAKTLNSLQQSHNQKREDIRLLEAFSLKNLQEQSLPPGCIYICGEWFDVGESTPLPQWLQERRLSALKWTTALRLCLLVVSVSPVMCDMDICLYEKCV